MKQQFKCKDVATRCKWAGLFSTAMTALLVLGAMIFPGGQGGAVHAAEKEKTFCELNPYDVTCAGGTCDIYTQYCPPWPGGASGGGPDGYNTWTIPRNVQNPYSYVTCTASSAEREAYATLAVQAHLSVINFYGGLTYRDPLFITFADGLVRSYYYFYDEYNPEHVLSTSEQLPCDVPQGLPPVLQIP